MKNRISLFMRQTILILLAYLLTTAECLSAGDLAEIDKASVRNIEVILDEDNLDQFGVTLEPSSIAAQIAKNLSDADFPVNKPSEKAFTHTLKAHLSRIEHQATPTGFSFSMGNSDPRAQDFQKADVITVECVLTSKQNPRETAKQTMEFNANSLKTLKDKNRISKTLSDHVSAACYDLLDDLALEESAVPATEGGTAIKRPRWMPDIRIEVKNEPAPEKNSTSGITDKPESAEEPRKEMTIHNKGTPVILKFGYDRK